MKRRITAPLLILLLVLVLAIPALADQYKPKKADGIWYYMPELLGIQMVEFEGYDGDPGKAFMSVPYDSQWTGTFNGVSNDYGLAITHGLDPMLFVATVSFDGEVDGSTGTLEMDVFGDRAAVGEDWKGPFVITSGTDGLEGLQGHGYWWGPGWLGDPSEHGVIYYVVEELQWPD